MQAAGDGHKDAVAALIQAKADVDAKNKDGYTGACGGRGAEAPTDSAQRSCMRWTRATRTL